MALEFGAVLTTQLESQRMFYEHQIETVATRRLQRPHAAIILNAVANCSGAPCLTKMKHEQGAAMSSLERRLNELSEQTRHDREAMQTVNEKLALAERDRTKLEAKYNQLATKYRDLAKQHQEEVSLHAALQQNYALLKEQDVRAAPTSGSRGIRAHDSPYI